VTPNDPSQVLAMFMKSVILTFNLHFSMFSRFRRAQRNQKGERVVHYQEATEDT